MKYMFHTDLEDLQEDIFAGFRKLENLYMYDILEKFFVVKSSQMKPATNFQLFMTNYIEEIYRFQFGLRNHKNDYFHKSNRQRSKGLTFKYG